MQISITKFFCKKKILYKGFHNTNSVSIPLNSISLIGLSQLKLKKLNTRNDLIDLKSIFLIIGEIHKMKLIDKCFTAIRLHFYSKLLK